MNIFNKVVSLGPDCQTAYQIRQVINQEEAYLFDWVIAPASVVSRAFENLFSEIIASSGLMLKEAQADRNFIYDSKSGIEYHHDFRNDHNFLESFDEVKSKYEFIKSRMIALLRSDAAVLFVHHEGTDEEVLSLEKAISTAFPTLSFKILEVKCNPDLQRVEQGRVVTVGISGDGESWQERTNQWASVLDDILCDSYGKYIQRKPDLQRP
jgi:hypothetical protein